MKKLLSLLFAVILSVMFCSAAFADEEYAERMTYVRIDAVAIDNITSAPVPGATFELKGTNGKTYTKKTNEKGIAAFVVPSGIDYTMRQISAPEGYTKPDTVTSVQFPAGYTVKNGIDWTGWVSRSKPTYTKTGGDFESFDYMSVTQEEIDAGGLVHVYVMARSTKFPHVPPDHIKQLGSHLIISQLGQDYSMDFCEGYDSTTGMILNPTPRDEYGTVYIDRPGAVSGGFYCRNADQSPNCPLPPFALEYEINLGKIAYMTPDTSFSFVNVKKDTPVPKTGDNANPYLPVVLMLLSAGTIVLVEKKKSY